MRSGKTGAGWALGVVLAAALMPGGVARAEDAALRLEDATITGHGGKLTLQAVPVKTAAGTVYKDIVIEFSADAAGNIVFARSPGSAMGAGVGVAVGSAPALNAVLQQAPTPPYARQDYKPGIYRGEADGSLMRLVFRGKPFNPMRDDPPVWELSPADTGGGMLAQASWYEGPMAQSPLKNRLRDAGVVQKGMDFGTIDAGDGTYFGSNTVIGVSESNGRLVIASFRKGCCSVASEPVARLSFVRIGE